MTHSVKKIFSCCLSQHTRMYMVISLYLDPISQGLSKKHNSLIIISIELIFFPHCSDTILHPSFDFCYYYSQSNEISTLNRQINCPLIMITHLFTGASRKVCYCTVINIVTYLCPLLLSDLCIFFLVSEIMYFKNELITYNKQNIMPWQDAK